ncbi:unnamed protein product [Mycena citricolor]|uniref:CCHC-type domain-containing protein n=1 Tax=Mycena citricolor TaxID=2018698 RepID=A0AAD2H695_9AGAR|nr:unnamed protein product [Mycena citricolor]
MSYMEGEDNGSSPKQRLGNLEEAMQQMEGLLHNLIIEQQQPSPAPAPSPAVGPGVSTGQQASSRPLICPNPPFAFDGDRTQGKTFLHSVKQYWRLLPEAFHVNGVVSEERVVRFALSYMSKDSAASWSERMSERLVFPFPTWSSFVAKFKLRFVKENEQDHALARLETHAYYMGSRDVFKYTDEFDDFLDLAGYKECCGDLRENAPRDHRAPHESTISYRFPSSSGSPSPPPIVPSSPDLAHQNKPGPSNPYLALPPPEDEIPDLDELPSEQPPSPPPTAPARTMSGHHRITLAANPPYFDGDKSKYLGFVDSCTTYIGAYRSEFSQDETKILFVLSYLRNKNGTSCAASRWAMNWKQHNFDGFQGLKAGVTSKNFLEELQRAFGDSNAEQVAAARLMALRQNKRSFADYISDFEMLASDAGYNVVDTTDDKGEYKKGDQDNILIEFLERGLSSEIASHLYNTGVPLPKAYGAFKAWCINIEANALRDQLRKALHAHSAPRPPPQFRPQVAPMTPAPAPARPAANEPVPMEIDRTHAHGRNIICYNCQQPGHNARNCPEPRKKRTFFNQATMLEEIKNGDKDNEFLKEIAEKLHEKGF